MKYPVVKLLELSYSAGEIYNHLQGWKNFFKFKEKSKLNKDIKDLHKEIDSLEEDNWDTQYVKDLQAALYQWKSILEDIYRKYGVHISNAELPKMDMYRTMYFQDKDYQIMIDVVGTNLKYTLFNLKNGRKYSTLSSGAGAKSTSQNSIESICKKKIIAIFHEYLNQLTGKKSS